MKKKKGESVEEELERKVDVLDTSVLVHDPDAVEKFKDNIVVVPIWVVEELDKLKSRHDEKGASSRAASRNLNAYRAYGSLKDGVKTASGGKVFIDYSTDAIGLLPIGLENTNDNKVILVARKWREEKGYKNVTIVSKDMNMLLKADGCNILAEDYRGDKCINDIDQLYSGLAKIQLTPELAGTISQLYVEKNLDVAFLSEIVGPDELFANQCCQLSFGADYALAMYEKESKRFRLILKPNDFREGAVKPINNEQALAYALLTDPRIQLVTLAGKAGTGKTLISLLAGYEQLGRIYSQVLIYRPNIEIGQKMGFLPGEIGEKFAPWMLPIFDNLSPILKRGCGKKQAHKSPRGKKKEDIEEADDFSRMCEKDGSFSAIRELISAGLIEISPIVYIRGRSLNNQNFVIIDEAQNLTPHQAKTIITRCGNGAKVVLTGDLTQIDNPYVNALSNGLAHVVEGFKGQETYGHITLEKSERSPLAELAANLL